MSLRADHAKAILAALGDGGRGAVTDLTPYASYLTQQSVVQGTSMLPRLPDQFLAGGFGPSMPAQVHPIDAERQGQVLPRITQYPVGYNLPTPPGATKLVDFKVLRNLADTYDVLRRAIEIRKQEVAEMDWEIVPEDPKDDGAANKSDIKALTTFFEHPDPIRGLTHADWIKMALEELFVVDALAIYPHPTWAPGKGVLGSDLFALEVLDGSTVKPLVDIRGARPLPPSPAYQQFVWGIPRTELMADLIAAAKGAPLENEAAQLGEFTSRQLFYKVYHPRSTTLYGFPNVEQIILTVNLALKRIQWHTTFFTDGTIPAGILHLPEEWTPDAIREFEEMWNGVMQGNLAWKHRVRAMPGTHGFTQLASPVHDMGFDEWLARITLAGMDVTGEELGLEPKSGLGGAGFSESQENILYRKSLKPLASFLEALHNEIIAGWFNRPDLRFKYLALEVEDEFRKAQTDNILIEKGIKTPNEARVERGFEPYPNELGSKPILITRQGPVLLEDVDAMSKSLVGLNPDGTPKAPAPVPGQPGQAQSGESNPADDPAAQTGDTSGTKAIAADLRRWEIKAMKAVRAGKPAAVRFDSTVIPQELHKALQHGLAKASTLRQVKATFADATLRAIALQRLEDQLAGELAGRAA